ncbi:MAG: outer membrane protein assembly factor BamD [Verrucomicrobia bacterium]|nr:outer membrane protein assembly factor BamD [Verrucomicrobiota bacterium]MCH8510396.1 outer membrane protein assembly factor BamD [Kiritimatiellia bacterium]
MNRFLYFLMLGALLGTGPTLTQARTPYEETIDDSRSRGFRLFGGPSREGPEAQWEKVQGFVEADRLRPAIRHAGYLVNTWPDHPRAVEAQRLIADLEFARENYERAFNAYQVLIDQYAGMFDYDAVLSQQLICAEKVEKQTSWALFGRYNNPLEAVPLYRQLITNAPHLDITPELLFRIGEIQMSKRKFAEAIQEYDLLEQRYPRSEFSVQAAFRRAEAFAEISNRHPTDLGPARSALAAYRYFLEAYPDSDKAEKARKRVTEFRDYLAERHFAMAKFYEKNMRQPEAALAAYQALTQQFPDSAWTDKAKSRIQKLTPEAPSHE